MAYLKKEFREKIISRQKEDADMLGRVLGDVCGEPRHEGKELAYVCPNCGAHALKYSPSSADHIFKCFNCNEVGGRTPINLLMAPGVGKSFDEAVVYVANLYGEVPEYEQERRPSVRKKASKDGRPQELSFCKEMLAASGLTVLDVTAQVYEHRGDSRPVRVATFQKGTMTPSMEVDREGDDMVIYYYDIEGQPCIYTPKAKGKEVQGVERQYWRVRYKYPDEHTDRFGKAMKYKSPTGAPTFIYYPERIRERYRKREPIDVLFIQEGEKKAEKACKHGILSVAVSGIQNLGMNGQLPEDLVKLISACQVKEVVFLMDSDLHDLSRHITENTNVATRPLNFFYAVQHYKEYMSGLKNRNLSVEIYYGHVLKNEAGDKGIDDLLTNTLKGKEEKLLSDIMTAKNEKSLTGSYVRLYKITTVNDEKIRAQFGLDSAKTFCQAHREELKDLAAFTFNGRKYRFNEKGELESAQPLERDEQFWEAVDEGRMNFFRSGALTFLERRGFSRYDYLNGDYGFVRIEERFVRTVAPHNVVDFIYNFAKDFLPVKVRELILSSGPQTLGAFQLARLQTFDGHLYRPDRGTDYLFFGDNAWRITPEHINAVPYAGLQFDIWEEQRHREQSVSLCGPLFKVSVNDADHTFDIAITPKGQECDFLVFLRNASDFTWRKKAEDVSDQERASNAQHLVSKLCAFGYLAYSYKDRSESRAVVAMDGKDSDFDEANGRTGKSLFGEALRHVLSSKVLNGKALGNSNGNRQFIWEGLTEKTRLVIGDDLLKDFDFDSLFSLITSDWPVNPKNHPAYTIPFDSSPKIFLSSNYAIAGDGTSYSARQWLLGFSDFYSDSHSPVDDFKALFFEEWDEGQWNLFWNFVAQCIQLYLRLGYTPSPDSRMNGRRLVQQIGEDFLSWADDYFIAGGGHLNVRILKSEMYKDFIDYVQHLRGPRFSMSVNSFCRRMGYYTHLRGFFFNPHRYDPVRKRWLFYDEDGRPKKRDLSNGREYYTIGSQDYYQTPEAAEAAASAPAIPGVTETESEEDGPYGNL